MEISTYSVIITAYTKVNLDAFNVMKEQETLGFYTTNAARNIINSCQDS